MDRLIEIIEAQIDAWSLAHLILPVSLWLITLSVFDEFSTIWAYLITIIFVSLPFLWEILDELYYSDFINGEIADYGYGIGFLDIRGASWLDCLLGILPIDILLFIYPNTIIESIIIKIIIVAISIGYVNTIASMFHTEEWIE